MISERRDPAITARGVRFTYRGEQRPALDGIDLDLPAGERGLLLGRTGAGKSTLVRCLNRAVPEFFGGSMTGSIRIAGFDCAGRRVSEMSRHVAVVFEDFETQIFSTSCLMEVAFALENRALDPARIRRRALDLLRRVGLAGYEERDPSTLSGGEKQRLVIASVMALDAPLLVLDEPASDLDPGGRQEVYRLIEEAITGSVLLVEHARAGIPAAGSGILLDDGRTSARWERGDARTWIDLAGKLTAAGVRPPPIAGLIHALETRRGTDGAGSGSVEVTSLEPEAIDRTLGDAGWRLEPPGPPKGPTPAAPVLLRCEGVTHAYDVPEGGKRPVLDRIDLELRQGEITAIIGHNGSGKTTLARLMAGLHAPTTGRVSLKDRATAGLTAVERARAIGFIFQNPDHQIFSSSVGEEVAFGPRNIGLRSEDVAARVEFALAATGLEAEISRDPYTMTKGERQRLALASVLACRPDLVIMDEPTTGLDGRETGKVMDVLFDLGRGGHTIVIITHALWLLSEPIRRVVVMNHGRIHADGSPREILVDEARLLEAGLRPPDLSRLSARRGTALLTVEEWVEALHPPEE